MSRRAGIAFCAMFLAIIAYGLIMMEVDAARRAPTNAECWSILHDRVPVEGFTAKDCMP